MTEILKRYINYSCWLAFEGHYRIVGIAVEDRLPPSFTPPSLIHRHKFPPCLHTQWVIGDVSEPDRYWVSLAQIEWQKLLWKGGEVGLWKCVLPRLLILPLTDSPRAIHPQITSQDSKVNIWIWTFSCKNHLSFQGLQKHWGFFLHNLAGFERILINPKTEKCYHVLYCT